MVRGLLQGHYATVTGNTNVVATNPVSDPANRDLANKGIIEDRSDVDLLYVDVGAGTIDLPIPPAWVRAYARGSRRGMNLDLEATLFDEFDFQVAQSDPTNHTFARFVGCSALGVSGSSWSDIGGIGGARRPGCTKRSADLFRCVFPGFDLDPADLLI